MSEFPDAKRHKTQDTQDSQDTREKQERRERRTSDWVYLTEWVNVTTPSSTSASTRNTSDTTATASSGTPSRNLHPNTHHRRRSSALLPALPKTDSKNANDNNNNDNEWIHASAPPDEDFELIQEEVEGEGEWDGADPEEELKERAWQVLMGWLVERVGVEV
ncbi:hypothetical protein BZA05DRAFT_416698 [Tricharina praecox]|uniref:uncharacterized protein n=1 Tax=Tricharina praecox TaxID=43433 RepID=UPI00221E5DD9|nr:uncharacterized protein BZA05DRAFT_416698 [Tricharina praecox]KAI5856098.1 hypothetical protein BZA05DRAFT_416698 [Tricharina praecox]